MSSTLYPALIQIVVVGPGRKVHSTFAVASSQLAAPVMREVSTLMGGGRGNASVLGAVLGPDWAEWVRAAPNPELERFGPVGRNGRKMGGDESAEFEFDDNLDELLGEESDNSADPSAAHSAPIAWDPSGPGPAPTRLNWDSQPPIQYHNTLVFPEEDTLEILRQKVFVITRIPMYRQHLFWAGAGDGWDTSYEIAGVRIPPLDQAPPPAMGPTKAENAPRIYSHEHLLSVANVSRQAPLFRVYVADLAEFMPSSGFADVYQMESFYWNFVRLYWPILTLECFAVFVRAEREMATLYPFLAVPRATLLAKFAAETAIVKNLHPTGEFIATGISSAITAATATVPAVYRVNTLSLRDLFDVVEVSPCIPEVCAVLAGGTGRHRAYNPPGMPRMNIGRKSILLRKQYAMNESNISFPTGIMLRAAVTMAISLRTRDQLAHHRKAQRMTSEAEQSRYIFLSIYSSGRYSVRSSWAEEELMDFNTLFLVLKRFVNPLLKDLGQKMGTEFTLMSLGNIEYSAISANIFWKKIIPKSAFRTIRTIIDKWRVAGILGPNLGFQDGEYKIQFVRGIRGYDPMSIDYALAIVSGVNLTNDFMHLSDSQIRTRWGAVYNGCATTLLNRTTDLRITVSDIRQSDFVTFQKYIHLFLWDIEQTLPRMTTMNMSTSSRMRRLREGDPVLYNIKKYKSTKNYSQTCQKPRQPILYTNDEIASMPARTRAKLGVVEYWNFTWSRPAYYSCPNMKYPHLSFIVGLHPKGFCMPCCNTKMSENAERRARINNVCFSKYVWQDDQTGEGGGGKSADILAHVMHTTRDLEAGRLAHMPSEWLPFFGQIALTNIIPGTVLEESVYLLGVAQHLPNLTAAAMFHTAAAILRLEWAEFTAQLVAQLARVDPVVFYTLIDGVLPNHFPDMKSFLASLSLLLSGSGVTGQTWPRNHWHELIAELVFFAFDTPIVTLMLKGGATQCFISPLLQNAITTPDIRIGFAASIGDDIYPVMKINPEQYSKTRQIANRTFTTTSVPGRNAGSIISLSAHKGCAIRAALVAAGVKPDRILCNLRGEEYALLINDVWIPVCAAVSTFRAPIEWGMIPAPTVGLDRVLPLLEKWHIPVKTIVSAPTGLVGVRIDSGIVRALPGGGATPSLPAEMMPFDPFEIDAAIAARAPPTPDGRAALIPRALYDNYSYILLLQEIAITLGEERDETLRAQLVVGGAKVEELLQSHPADLATIRAGMRRGKGIDMMIRNTNFGFDCTTLRRAAAEPDSIPTIAAELVAAHSVTGTLPDQFAFPNVYEPCRKGDGPLCRNGRLVLEPGLAEEYTLLLVEDLANPLRRREFIPLYGANRLVLDELDFAHKPNQIITAFNLIE